MLHQRLLFLLSLAVYVSADAEPAQRIYTRNDGPKWMPFECDSGYDCPLMQRRKRKSHSEICILSSPNWYKFRWESKAEKFDRSKAESVSAPLSRAFQQKNFLEVLYLNNRKKLIEKGNEKGLAYITHVKFDQFQRKYIIHLYLMIPKLAEGDFRVPCSRLLPHKMGQKIIGPIMKLLGAENCPEFLGRFQASKVRAAPRCFYAVDKSQDSVKLQKEMGWDQNEFVATGFKSGELNEHEWHLAPNNLYTEYDNDE